MGGTPTINGTSYVAANPTYNTAITDKITRKTQLDNEECDYIFAAARDLFGDNTHYS